MRRSNSLRAFRVKDPFGRQRHRREPFEKFEEHLKDEYQREEWRRQRQGEIKTEFSKQKSKLINGEKVDLPPLKCPGGPRLGSTAIKDLYQVPTAGHLAKYDHRFVLNLSLTHSLMRFVNKERMDRKVFVEIGPACGMLTRALLSKQCRGVFGIEMDARWNPHLTQISAHTSDQFRWVNSDILEVDEITLMAQHFPELKEELEHSIETLDDVREYQAAQRRAARDALDRQIKDRARRRQEMAEKKRRMEAEAARATKRKEKHMAAEEKEEAKYRKERAAQYGLDEEELPKTYADEQREKQREAKKERMKEDHRDYSKYDFTDSAFVDFTGRTEGFDNDDEEAAFIAATQNKKHKTLQDPQTGEAITVCSNNFWKFNPSRLEVVGNLPFDMVNSLLIRYCVDSCRKQNLFRFGRVPMTFFFQREQAERILATPGTTAYGKFTPLIQNYFHVYICSTFFEQTYFPQTETIGAMVRFEPKVEPTVDVDAAVLWNFLAVAFSGKSRQYSVFESLSRHIPEEVVKYMMRELRLDGMLPPSHIPPTDFAKLALLWIKFLESSSQVHSPGGSEAFHEQR